MAKHLHTFTEPVEDKPHARQCSECGEPQVFNLGKGRGPAFTDVLVEKADLRALLDYAEGALEEHGFDPSNVDLVVQVRELLER